MNRRRTRAGGTVIALALAGLAAGSAGGAPLDYMRKATPNTLYCMASVGETCPVSDDDVHAAIDAVLRRFSLDRMTRSTSGEPMLYLDVHCHDGGDEGLAWAVEAGFAEWIGRDRQHLMKYAYYPYKSVGIGGRETLLQTLTRRVEDALGDYLDANFPEGEPATRRDGVQ